MLPRHAPQFRREKSRVCRICRRIPRQMARWRPKEVQQSPQWAGDEHRLLGTVRGGVLVRINGNGQSFKAGVRKEVSLEHVDPQLAQGQIFLDLLHALRDRENVQITAHA